MVVMVMVMVMVEAELLEIFHFKTHQNNINNICINTHNSLFCLDFKSPLH